MNSITTKELEIESDLKRKIEFICDFCNTKPTIINGNIRNIDKSNLSYVEPHRIIIKGITFLAFNYSKTLCVGNLANKLEIKDYIKQTQDTTANLKTTNDLTTILEHYENNLKNHSKEVKNLQQKIKNGKSL